MGRPATSAPLRRGAVYVAVNSDSRFYMRGQQFVLSNWYWTKDRKDLFYKFKGRIGSFQPRNFIPIEEAESRGVEVLPITSMDSALL